MDIDQLIRIINVLGKLEERAWSDCSKLPDYEIILFSKVENSVYDPFLIFFSGFKFLEREIVCKKIEI
jgi:hypothetical protein